MEAELPKRSNLPPALADSVSYVLPSQICLADYKRAVIFYWAPWSGPAHAVWTELLSKLAKVELPLQILLIHYDYGTDPMCTTLFGTGVGAWGETCWVRNGEIIGREVFGRCAPGQTRAERLTRMDELIKELSL
ncbi:hypothetical protein KA344_06975 [bacterium]|nr:hypothetical protein [bacterium]